MKLFKFFCKMCIFTSLLVFLVFGCTEECTSPDDDTVKYYGWTTGGGSPDDNYGTVLHTQDGGVTWIDQSDSLLFAGVNFSDICVIDKNNILVSGNPQINGVYGVFKSEDGGNSWTLSGARSLANVDYRGLFTLDENNVWIVGEQGSVYHSADKGDTWTKLEVPTEYQQDSFNRVAAKNSDDIWVGGDWHVNDDYPIILHTVDGGTNWERLNPIEELDVNTGGFPGYCLGVKVYGNSVWIIGGQGEWVIRSADNGATWENITSGTLGGNCDANDIFLIGESAAYLVTDYGGFYSTNDGGLHWAQFFTDTNNWVVGVTVLNESNVWICGCPGGAGESSVIKYSANGGTTWQDQTPQLLIDNPQKPLYKIRFIEVN